MPRKNDKKSETKPNKKDGMSTVTNKTDDGTLLDKGKDAAQIRLLEQRSERYQRKCDELELQMIDFTAQYNTLQKEKKDIVSYLKRSLAQKEDELTDLSEHLVSLEQAKNLEMEMQDKQLRQELQESKDKLTSENAELVGKLASLDDFRVEKERLMAENDSLKKQLVIQKEEDSTAIYNLERKALLDKDRLKEEMHSHVAAVAAEFQRVSEQRMPETTKRAIHENVALTTQLKQLSDQGLALLEENRALQEQKKHLRLEVSILVPLVTQMTHRSRSNQKVVEQLTEKCKLLQAQLEERSSAHLEQQQLQMEHTGLLAEMETLRQDHVSVLKECVRNRAEVERLGAELVEERKRQGQLESILQDVAMALKQALKEVPKEKDSEVDTIVRRNHMMQKVLAVLDGAALLGKGPTMTDFISEPVADRSGQSHVQLSQFKTGDLGLVPRPRQTHNSNTMTSKTEPKNTHLHLNRKPSVQKMPCHPKLSAPDHSGTDRFMTYPVRPCPKRKPSHKPNLK